MPFPFGRASGLPLRRSGLIARLAAIPTGRRAKWLLLVHWLVLVAAVSPFAGKLTSVEKNDNAAWLPINAESTGINDVLQRFSGGQSAPAAVVYRNPAGLTAADRAKNAADRLALAKRFPQTPPGFEIPSQDGNAVIYSLPLTSDADHDPDEVNAIRDIVGEGHGTVAIKVTGPAGFPTDLVNVFGGVDTTLLLATAAVVAVLLLLTYRSLFLWLVPLIVVARADQGATGAVYALAKHGWLTVNGQSQRILPVLICGAGTDYALLLTG